MGIKITKALPLGTTFPIILVTRVVSEQAVKSKIDRSAIFGSFRLRGMTLRFLPSFALVRRA